MGLAAVYRNRNQFTKSCCLHEEAINLLKPALDEFSREDGQQLLAKLELVRVVL